MDHIQAEQLVARYGQTIYRLAYARTGSRMSSFFFCFIHRLFHGFRFSLTAQSELCR